MRGDLRFNMRIAKSYIVHGFATRASQAIEAQLGLMNPREMTEMRTSMAKNQARGRPQELKAMDKARAHPADLRKKGREWAGARYEREQSPERLAIGRLRSELSKKFEALAALKVSETELKASVSARLNVVVRVFHRSTVGRLEKVKQLMNDRREKAEKLAAAPQTRSSRRKAATVASQTKVLRKEYGRLQRRIQARMTSDEKEFAGQIREQKQRVLAAIAADKAMLRHLKASLARDKEHARTPLSASRDRSSGRSMELER